MKADVTHMRQIEHLENGFFPPRCLFYSVVMERFILFNTLTELIVKIKSP